MNNCNVCKKQEIKAMRASKDYKQTENGLKLISWGNHVIGSPRIRKPTRTNAY
jgi:hypothetical protein